MSTATTADLALSATRGDLAAEKILRSIAGAALTGDELFAEIQLHLLANTPAQLAYIRGFLRRVQKTLEHRGAE